ncbi:MAG TPA: hypothetical protein VGC39_00490 [Candidatus Methylacidiphilales bacterium]
MKASNALLSALAVICLIALPAREARADKVPDHTPSTSLILTVEGKAVTLSVADLNAMPQSTLVAHDAHTKLDESYTGVSLGALLAKYGFPVDKSTRDKMLHGYLVAEGTDKYWVLFSVTEVEASEHTGDVIIATSMGGKPLGDDGQFRLIDNADKKPERWVRNLSTITVKSSE